MHEGQPPNRADLLLECPSAPITAQWFGCTNSIGAQEWPNAIQYEVSGSGSARVIKMQVVEGTPLKYEQAGCAYESAGTYTGRLSGSWTLKGYTSALAQRGIWIE
jgi:hypothetical protein